MATGCDSFLRFYFRAIATFTVVSEEITGGISSTHINVHFPCSFAQESRNEIVRMNTGLPGFESVGSARK